MKNIMHFLSAAAAATCLCGPAAAELRLVVAATPDHLLTLEDRPSEMQAELTALVDDAPLLDVIHCETLVERLLPVARRAEIDMDVIVAQYNLVNLWLGNLCPGADGFAFSNEEARAWLTDLSGLRRESDDAPFLNAHEMLLEFYLFGAPGFAPDSAAASTFLAATLIGPRAKLYAAYMADRALGTPADPARSVALLDEAASGGDWAAGALLAQALETGRGVAQDETAAFRLYSELAAGIAPPVWYRLGMMYLDGRGVAADACEARAWLRQAAGHAWSPVAAARSALERIENSDLCPR